MLKGGNEFVGRVHRAGDGFGVGEYYGIVGKASRTLLTERERKPSSEKKSYQA